MRDFDDRLIEGELDALSLEDLASDVVVCCAFDPGDDPMPLPDDFPLGGSDAEPTSTEPSKTDEQ